MKKRTIRLVAIIACFSILTLSVPGAIAADKKGKKINFRNIIEKPMWVLSTIFPFISPIYDTGTDNSITNNNNNTYSGKIKITDSVPKAKPPDGGD